MWCVYLLAMLADSQSKPAAYIYTQSTAQHFRFGLLVPLCWRLLLSCTSTRHAHAHAPWLPCMMNVARSPSSANANSTACGHGVSLGNALSALLGCRAQKRARAHLHTGPRLTLHMWTGCTCKQRRTHPIVEGYKGRPPLQRGVARYVPLQCARTPRPEARGQHHAPGSPGTL